MGAQKEGFEGPREEKGEKRRKITREIILKRERELGEEEGDSPRNGEGRCCVSPRQWSMMEKYLQL